MDQQSQCSKRITPCCFCIAAGGVFYCEFNHTSLLCSLTDLLEIKYKEIFSFKSQTSSTVAVKGYFLSAVCYPQVNQCC